MSIRLKIAILTAGFSAVVGSFVSAIIFCLYTIICTTGVRSAADFAIIPGIGFMAGILGFIAALPTAMALGIPIVWLLGRQFAGSPIVSSILLGLFGGFLGRWMFVQFFNDGLGVFIDTSRYACPIFGAVVAGCHPVFASRLYRDNNGAPS